MNSSVYERISYADSLYNIKKDGLFLMNRTGFVGDFFI